MRLHVIDGTYELFRAHYSRRPTRIAPDGMDVKGTLGVVSSLLGLLADPEEAVTHIAVAFDSPIESFRNDLFDGYKTGAGMDPALVAQMDLVEEATAALGIVVWSMDAHEADDALGTAAHRWGDGVDQVRIMTPDKDLGQVVVGNRIVQVDRMRRKVIDADGVRQKNGVDPECIPDWLALVGDTADGIPGVPGFGAKTAATLLNRFRTIDAIPRSAFDWPAAVRGAPRLAKALNEHREAAALYRRLATLDCDVPLPERLVDLEWQGADREAFERLTERLGGIAMQPQRWR
ncbi:MAG: flap endonuclease [Gammaproteobacteria bacterium]|nr:flap endonuclease [Gammaproteobacteria bacterium]